MKLTIDGTAAEIMDLLQKIKPETVKIFDGAVRGEPMSVPVPYLTPSEKNGFAR